VGYEGSEAKCLVSKPYVLWGRMIMDIFNQLDTKYLAFIVGFILGTGFGIWLVGMSISAGKLRRDYEIRKRLDG